MGVSIVGSRITVNKRRKTRANRAEGFSNGQVLFLQALRDSSVRILPRWRTSAGRNSNFPGNLK